MNTPKQNTYTKKIFNNNIVDILMLKLKKYRFTY
jgi:hypothetical protein